MRGSEDDVSRGSTRRGMKTKSGEAGGGRVSRPQGHMKNHGLWPESNGKPVKILSRYRARVVLGKCHCGDSEQGQLKKMYRETASGGGWVS